MASFPSSLSPSSVGSELFVSSRFCGPAPVRVMLKNRGAVSNPEVEVEEAAGASTSSATIAGGLAGGK